MSVERSPMYRGFEYRVWLRVSIPRAWAEGSPQLEALRRWRPSAC